MCDTDGGMDEQYQPEAAVAGAESEQRDEQRQDAPAASEQATSTCLRPLGLCELGGCCEVCWYRPDHPRFSKR